MASTPGDCRCGKYHLCARPGELARWVKTTHPASVNADSIAGERRASAVDNGPNLHSKPVRPKLFTDEIGDHSTLYGFRPAPHPPTEDKETMR
jgi:hypothetical protein